MIDQLDYQGIYPALLTPFNKDYSINESALRQLVRFNLKKGVKGFYACGSTAEAFMMTVEQRKQALEIVVDEAKNKAKVIAHIGTISQNQAVDLAKHAAKCGVDMISSIPPFYYGFAFDQIKGYYFALADAVDVPVLIYHFPANSGVQLTAEKVGEFLKDERFAGIKFTSNDFFMLQQIKAQHKEAVVFNGYDEIFLAGLSMGADGGIGSTYNLMAEKYIKMFEMYHNGQMQEALQIQIQANNIIQMLIKLGVMPAEKAALELMGIPMGECLKPMPAVSDEGKMELRKVLLANGCQLA